LIESYAIRRSCGSSLTVVTDWLHRRRHALRLAGLALLACGLAVALVFDALAGLVVIALSAVPLVLAQPLILARARSRAARKVAHGNGHTPGTGPEDLDVRDRD